MADYEFITIWRFKAPQEKVWDLMGWGGEGLAKRLGTEAVL